MDRKTRSAEARIKELDLELQFAGKANYACNYQFWMKRGGSIVVAGYMASDGDCSDPLESCDGVGKIITRHEDRAFRRLVGCDDSDMPEMDEYLQQLARLRGINIDEIVSDRLAVQAAFDMWSEARKRGLIGTPYAQALMMSQRGYQWTDIDKDGNKLIEAVWVPDKYLLEHIMSFPEKDRFAEAEKCFNDALDEYNKWAEGDCWGVCLDVFRRIDGEYILDQDSSEACWGYIGNEHASEMLDEEISAMKAHLKKEQPCKSKRHFRSSVHSPMA
jgi:hypothetical protein